jgi:uncharacterized membrane protein
LAIVVSGLVLLSPTVRHELAISFTRQPDSYTELYFTGPVPVSTAQVAGRQEITVSFAITNHEGHPSQYVYVVRVLDPSTTSTTERMGDIAVGNGEKFDNHIALALPHESHGFVVDVNIVGRTEAIHYTASDARTPGG